MSNTLFIGVLLLSFLSLGIISNKLYYLFFGLILEIRIRKRMKQMKHLHSLDLKGIREYMQKEGYKNGTFD